MRCWLLPCINSYVYLTCDVRAVVIRIVMLPSYLHLSIYLNLKNLPTAWLNQSSWLIRTWSMTAAWRRTSCRIIGLVVNRLTSVLSEWSGMQFPISLRISCKYELFWIDKWKISFQCFDTLMPQGLTFDVNSCSLARAAHANKVLRAHPLTHVEKSRSIW